MAQILQPYETALVHNDVTNDQTLCDLFYNLERLSATIDDVFARIERRVHDERQRLAHINTRVATCHGKVNLVRGSNRATTVFSTSKFPAPRDLPAYPTLFSHMSEPTSPYRDVGDDEQYHPPHPRASSVGNSEATAQCHLLLGRINTHGSDMERVEFVMEDEGLGPLPSSVLSVGSMLLFNSNINPYKNYQVCGSCFRVCEWLWQLRCVAHRGASISSNSSRLIFSFSSSSFSALPPLVSSALFRSALLPLFSPRLWTTSSPLAARGPRRRARRPRC